MTDKIIIDIIAKTYFAIVSFFSFIFLFFIMMFIIFQNGLYLDNLHFSNIRINKIFINWNNGIDVSVQTLMLTKEKKKYITAFKTEDFNKYIMMLSKFQGLIHNITIKKITAPNLNAVFSYTPSTNGFLNLDYKNYTLKSNIYFKDNILKLNIKDIHDKNNTMQINGEVFLNAVTNRTFAKLNGIVNNDLNITAFAIANAKNMQYTLVSHNPIKNFKALMKKIPLNKNLVYWTYDAIKVKDVNLKSFYGTLEFQNIKNFYKQIYAKIEADNLSYKYNPNLDPVISQKTILEFQKGILVIKPIQAYSYNTYLQASWLQIDFGQKHIWLDLYLLLEGKLNDNILSILQTYKINLPFRQTQGKIDVDLHVGIDLQTIKTQVQGDFYTDDSVFNFMGLDLNASNAKIHLDNTKVTTNNMNITYENILSTNAALIYDAKQETGSIDFLVNELNASLVTLSNETKPLHAVYKIDGKNSTLNIYKSKWNYLNQVISLAPFSFVLDVHHPYLDISPVLFSVNNIAKGYIGGVIDINDSKANMDVDLFDFNYGGIALDQSNAAFKITYNKVLNIKSANDLYLRVNGSPYTVKKAKVMIDDSSIKLKHTVVKLGKLITTKIYAKYNYKTNKAHMSLNDFLLRNPNTNEILYKNSKILLRAHIGKNDIDIKSPELNAEFYSNANLWKLDIHSLGRISKNAPILKDLQLTSGEVSLYKKSNEAETQFKAKFTYPYVLIFQKKKPIKEYKISGKIKKNLTIYFDVNENIRVKINDKIKISANNIGINIQEIIRLVQDIMPLASHKDHTKMLLLNTTNSYIYIDKDRKAISDKINLQYSDSILTAQLDYKQGSAGFRLEKNNFHLYGTNFNDTFMQNFSSLAKLKGGYLDFSIGGKLDDYNGVLYIENTTILDYKLLNNVLAFINTIPALVTFSLPNYNSEGLHIENGYMNFHYKKNVFNILDLYLDSKELKILGKGNADIQNNKIDLAINLKTDLGSNISRIPLVGYILLDGESISTSLKVSGKLTDPTIQTQVAQDIIVAPLNIIKRTFTLPYILLQKAVSDNNRSK